MHQLKSPANKGKQVTKSLNSPLDIQENAVVREHAQALAQGRFGFAEGIEKANPDLSKFLEVNRTEHKKRTE